MFSALACELLFSDFPPEDGQAEVRPGGHCRGEEGVDGAQAGVRMKHKASDPSVSGAGCLEHRPGPSDVL